jgi:hypothetical protein
LLRLFYFGAKRILGTDDPSKRWVNPNVTSAVKEPQNQSKSNYVMRGRSNLQNVIIKKYP